MKIAPLPATPASPENGAPEGSDATAASPGADTGFAKALQRARAATPRKAEAAQPKPAAGPRPARGEHTSAGDGRAATARTRAAGPGDSTEADASATPQAATAEGWPATREAQAWLAAAQAGSGQGAPTTDAPVLPLPPGSPKAASSDAEPPSADAEALASGPLSAPTSASAHPASAHSRTLGHHARAAAAAALARDAGAEGVAEPGQAGVADGRFGQALQAALQAPVPAGGAAGSGQPATPTAAAAAQVAAAAAGQPGPADTLAATAQASLAPVVGEPAFAPALASQLATFVRDGITQAELSLNPAEMGPVLVSIAVEGTQAQVEFSASQAFTRVALEQSLPALASALHQAGFTLTGGGVSDQRPRGQGRDGAQGGGTPGLAVKELGSTGARTGAAARRGNHLLDLYA